MVFGPLANTDLLSENLDYNEFAATIDDISLAVASHHSRLGKFKDPHPT